MSILKNVTDRGLNIVIKKAFLCYYIEFYMGGVQQFKLKCIKTKSKDINTTCYIPIVSLEVEMVVDNAETGLIQICYFANSELGSTTINIDYGK